MMKTVYLRITGQVQGVFFRASARDVAEKSSVTGWVKNTLDFVEAEASGDKDDVDAFVRWCQSGPSRARVEKVEITELEYKAFDRFSVIRG